MNISSDAVTVLREPLRQLRQRMEKAVSDLQTALASLRPGRASVHLLDGVRVDYYGTEMPVNQVATLHTPDPQMITVQPYDASLLGAIEKAIRSADLGLNPASDGKLLRITIPPLTEERRRDLAKHMHKILEDHRTELRNIRRDGNDAAKKLKADKKLSEDEERRAHEDIQKLTDAEIKKLEELAAAKEKELMKV